MKLFLHSLFLVILSLLSRTSSAADDFLSVHGSGTTNPSKCYWSIMKELMAQSKVPIRMTYRAVGSTTGQAEFVNDNNVTASAAHFGSGDLPMTDVNFAGLDGAGIGMYHLPVLIGAVSFFHSVPGVHRLNMTGTILAKIYAFDITDWNDPAIKDINPNLNLPSGDDTTIRPVRRAKGSSSTAAAKEFMHAVDPVEWPSDLVSSKADDWPEWTGNAEDTPVLVCHGSSGVATCIDSTKYAIGYIDAGHGNDAGLPEIRLQNADGEFLTTQDSLKRGGLETAERNVLPNDPDANFADVSLINRPGKDSWPMVALTYIYVRKDLSFIDPVTRGALFGFFRALYDPSYIQVCKDKYDFLLPSPEIQAYGNETIDRLEADNPDTVKWSFEGTSAQAIAGAGEYVFSAKRESSYKVIDEDELNEAIFEIEESMLLMTQEITTLQAKIDSMNTEMGVKDDEIQNLRNIVADVESEQEKNAVAPVVESDFTDDDEQQLKAALVLSIMSFLFWVLFIFYSLLSFFRKP